MEPDENPDKKPRAVKRLRLRWRWGLCLWVLIVVGFVWFSFLPPPPIPSRAVPFNTTSGATIYQFSSNRFVVFEADSFHQRSQWRVAPLVYEVDLDVPVIEPIEEFERVVEMDELKVKNSGGVIDPLFSVSPDGNSVICWQPFGEREVESWVSIARRGFAEESHFKLSEMEGYRPGFRMRYGILADGERWVRATCDGTNVFSEIRDFEGRVLDFAKNPAPQGAKLWGFHRDQLALTVAESKQGGGENKISIVFQDLLTPKRKRMAEFDKSEDARLYRGTHGMTAYVFKSIWRYESIPSFPFFQREEYSVCEDEIFFCDDGREARFRRLSGRLANDGTISSVSWSSMKLLEDGETFAIPADGKILYLPKD